MALIKRFDSFLEEKHKNKTLSFILKSKKKKENMVLIHMNRHELTQMDTNGQNGRKSLSTSGVVSVVSTIIGPLKETQILAKNSHKLAKSIDFDALMPDDFCQFYVRMRLIVQKFSDKNFKSECLYIVLISVYHMIMLFLQCEN